jgi:hypothetical protein
MRLANADETATGNPATSTSLPANGDPSPQKSKRETTEVDTGLVFSGREREKARTSAPAAAPPPAPLAEVAALPLMEKQQRDPLPATIVIPPSDPKPIKKGFFGKIRGLFGAMFH